MSRFPVLIMNFLLKNKNYKTPTVCSPAVAPYLFLHQVVAVGSVPSLQDWTGINRPGPGSGSVSNELG